VSSGEGQGHTSKRRVCVLCARVVWLRVNDNIVGLQFMQWLHVK